MKTFRNIMLCVLILVSTFIILACTVYNYKIGPVSDSEEEIEVVIESGASTSQIAQLLEDKGLIRDKDFFLIYAKLFEVNNIKASTYILKPNMGVKKIVEVLQEGNSYNPDQITIQFIEGLNIRQVAEMIADKTTNSYDSIIAKTQDEEYLKTLIDKYWFLDESILEDGIYYGLEGYLFPNTYYFNNEEVGIDEIFTKMLDQMDKVLTPYKDELTSSGKTVHEILTMASMIEKEGAANTKENPDVRKNVASVFYNRISRNMSLGSDVTTRYALKIDNAKEKLDSTQYQYKSPYNTRLTDGSMNGKLPIGPICGVSKDSIEAAIHPTQTDYIYFVANIATKETFFFNNSQDYEKKKQELSSVNQGL